MSKNYRSERQSTEDDWGNAFQDTTGRCPLDQLLRKHGWKIVSRAEGREAVWEKDGVKLPERQALKTIPRDELSDQEMAEAFRLGGYE